MKELSPTLESLLHSARDAGVRRFLVAGFDEPSSGEALKLAKERKEYGVFAAVGIHPHDAKTCLSGELPESLKHWAGSDCAVAIGETGLDYHYDLSPRDIQGEVFRRHIGLAVQFGKPLVVHVREAYDEALEILREEKADRCGGVIHCFAGEWRHASEAMDLGFFVSFAGPVTYPRSNGLREVASMIPADRLLCETDSPYLAPQPWRGKTNQPAYVAAVYETIAAARKTRVEDLAEEVWQNAARLFGWGMEDV
jgi:TatD DNase family protein